MRQKMDAGWIVSAQPAFSAAIQASMFSSRIARSTALNFRTSS